MKMNIVEKLQSPTRTLLDVREGSELLIDGMINEAVHIPMGEIPDRLDELKQYPTPLLVFCRAGGRAQSVVDYLKQNGFDEVYNAGGYSELAQILNQ